MPGTMNAEGCKLTADGWLCGHCAADAQPLASPPSLVLGPGQWMTPGGLPLVVPPGGRGEIRVVSDNPTQLDVRTTWVETTDPPPAPSERDRALVREGSKRNDWHGPDAGSPPWCDRAIAKVGRGRPHPPVAASPVVATIVAQLRADAAGVRESIGGISERSAVMSTTLGDAADLIEREHPDAREWALRLAESVCAKAGNTISHMSEHDNDYDPAAYEDAVRSMPIDALVDYALGGRR